MERHNATPATVRGGASADDLEHISCHEWVEMFEEKGLVLLYQEHKAGGEDSTFCKLVSR